MRITGGMARGIPLKTADQCVRPATDRMREALFSSIASYVEGACFADLFAGTGSYGLEAISRGAVSGCFVEKNPRVCQILKANLAATLKSVGGAAKASGSGLDAKAFKVVTGDAARVRLDDAAFDLVFCDPPYEIIAEVESDVFGLSAKILKPDGLLAFEMPASARIGNRRFNELKCIGKGAGDAPTIRIFRIA